MSDQQYDVVLYGFESTSVRVERLIEALEQQKHFRIIPFNNTNQLIKFLINSKQCFFLFYFRNDDSRVLCEGIVRTFSPYFKKGKIKAAAISPNASMKIQNIFAQFGVANFISLDVPIKSFLYKMDLWCRSLRPVTSAKLDRQVQALLVNEIKHNQYFKRKIQDSDDDLFLPTNKQAVEKEIDQIIQERLSRRAKERDQRDIRESNIKEISCSIAKSLKNLNFIDCRLDDFGDQDISVEVEKNHFAIGDHIYLRLQVLTSEHDDTDQFLGQVTDIDQRDSCDYLLIDLAQDSANLLKTYLPIFEQRQDDIEDFFKAAKE